MKLSEMTTDRAMDVLCEITPYIANIVSDEELLAELRKAVDPKEASTKAEIFAKGAEKITKLVPIVLKKHKRDVFGILAAMDGGDEIYAQTIGKQNILVTMAQIRDMAKDKELMDFFKSCASTERSE